MSGNTPGRPSGNGHKVAGNASRGGGNQRRPNTGKSGRAGHSSASPASANGASRSERPKTSARALAVKVLSAVEQEGAYSNLELNRRLKEAELSPADAGLATELVYGTIARRNTLDYFLERYVAKGVFKLQPWVRSLLRISVYQMLYLDRIPEHAVVSEAVNLAKKLGHQGISGMVNGVLRNMIRNRDELRIPEHLSAAERISLEHSHPLWMVERWISHYGEETAEAICRANNEPPAVSVRVNTTMTTREKLMQEMESTGAIVEPSRLSPDGILVRSGGNMAHTSWYRDGLLSVQDESSMLVAEAVGPEDGQTVLDCCAAPGGKTAHMAEKMQDRGRIVANDVHAHKRQLIMDQADRLGLSCIDAVTGDALDLDKRYPEESFDRILLDAPCSGLGVIRRKPDVKWTKTAEDIQDISNLQRELLDRVAPLLKPGGILVYSTCTIEPAENEHRIADFLARHPEYKAAKDSAWSGMETADLKVVNGGVQILPQYAHSDGFFIARLTRIAD
ncbi:MULTISPECIES: 16S rRNA (cytosine(967)-C(5))-methyltransferase RsmB [Paenibacillus]|uniref:16S rRNA (cytosine(967)-C(5))-methyltransferase n=1 Tax=Paenibacillus pabuli TaxID=1472 RepID=A0A855YFE9_9BACL|nr:MULTISPECIES: 16S rRNA (cytosine(967)-C(5))-methyltransferase RsmB [Paenibacillus]PWW44279.1 16S rRNA (cytosine967-C5)-methyltransferase [Paenibacillus pabuli]PXW10307.1 16S rRNA (cytosine967-C5)-methyltransferase [Paenibacillus taichungensis]